MKISRSMVSKELTGPKRWTRHLRAQLFEDMKDENSDHQYRRIANTFCGGPIHELLRTLCIRVICIQKLVINPVLETDRGVGLPKWSQRSLKNLEGPPNAPDHHQ